MKEKVIEILNQINPQIGQDMDADLLEEGLINSFEIVNIVMNLEDAIGIEIDPDLINAANFKSMRNIVALIEGIAQR